VDLKPFFAYLFPQVGEGYDWWGHLDNDMLLGNVHHFVTPEMLRNYDMIFTSPSSRWYASNMGSIHPL
jgi:hypothetical protein